MVKSAMVFSHNLSPRSGLAELEFRDVQALAWRNVINEI
jgi:hypothetical protein